MSNKCIVNDKWVTTDMLIDRFGTVKFCVRKVKIQHLEDGHVWIKGVGLGVVRTMWNRRMQKTTQRARVSIEILN